MNVGKYSSSSIKPGQHISSYLFWKTGSENQQDPRSKSRAEASYHNNLCLL